MFQKNSNISVIAVTDSSFVLRQSVLQFCGSGFVCPLKHQAKEPWEVWNGYKSLLPAAPHKKINRDELASNRIVSLHSGRKQIITSSLRANCIFQSLKEKNFQALTGIRNRAMRILVDNYVLPT